MKVLIFVLICILLFGYVIWRTCFISWGSCRTEGCKLYTGTMIFVKNLIFLFFWFFFTLSYYIKVDHFKLIFSFFKLFKFLQRSTSFFLGYFLFWLGPTVEKSRPFFLKKIFFIFTSTHITTRQTGGEGWWVVNSPCLFAITTLNLTVVGHSYLFF